MKIGFMILLGLGGFHLLRQYGASAPWAVAVATALPFAGFTLYDDASSWVAGLAAQAWTPWFWWVARRCLHGTANPIFVYGLGYLLVTNGNPYGAVSAVIVLAALAVEGVLTRRWSGLGRLVVAGLCVGTTVGVAYLPMLATASSGWRGEFAAFVNDGQLVPDLSMLSATSSPSLFPLMARLLNRDPLLAAAFAPGASTVPLTYTAWFLTPLLPWLHWRVLRGRARELSGVSVLGVFFALLTLGPSQLWLFRWPIRLLPYVFLAVGVALGVLLSSGVRVDRPRLRLAVSGGVVALGGWVALAPQRSGDDRTDAPRRFDGLLRRTRLHPAGV